jgi:hypothetical protein
LPKADFFSIHSAKHGYPRFGDKKSKKPNRPACAEQELDNDKKDLMTILLFNFLTGYLFHWQTSIDISS